MKITNEQIEMLNSFTCERLSESRLSKESASKIENERGTQLIGYLNHHGNDEDSKGIIAFYVIRNKENMPLAFFSIKCGGLFYPSMIDFVENDVVYQQQLIALLNNDKNSTNPEITAFFNAIENIAIKLNISMDQMIENLKKNAKIRKQQALEYKTAYHADEKTEENKPIYRVHITIPGIEIVHFCTNEKAKSFWNNLHFNHTMGEVLFWWFIVPILQKVQQIVGCQYAYLFAADSTEDRTLINYYNVALKFIKPEGIGTSKPLYDFRCEFLLQEISKLISFRNEYFDNFNLDKNTEII